MYGGSCPKCFGEIPGEEAATDPGEQVKAEQAKSDNRRMLAKTLVPLALAVPLLGGLAALAVGFIVYNRNPVAEVMVFDDVEEFSYDIVSAPEPSEVEQVAANTGTRRPTPRPATTGTREPAPEAVQKTDAMGIPVVEVEGTAKAPSQASGGLNFGGIGVEASRSGEVLSDPGQIRSMLSQKMRAYGGQLKLCYDKRLKVKPELQGRWKASFVVQESGYPSEVRFTGADMKDAELEQCMAQVVRKWKFSRISQAQPVEKNWRFRQ